MAFANSDSNSYWQSLRRQYAPGPFLAYGVNRMFRISRSGPSDAERLRAINHLGIALKTKTTGELAAQGRELRDRVRSGSPLEESLEESFALVREMSLRVLGLFPYDVQILGGLALARGAIAEMATGEGKTLVQLLPAHYYGLSGKGVHLATANSYLAERDQESGNPVLKALGLSSALLPEQVPPTQKRKAYQADVTYGTGSEFGFDYLRDQLVLMSRPERLPGQQIWENVLGNDEEDLPLAQRGLHVAILDEADSILVDEAVTPLLISGRSNGENLEASLYQSAEKFLSILTHGVDFEEDSSGRSIYLTEKGHDRIHELSSEIEKGLLRRPWSRYIENALRAKYILKRDRQYLVRDDAALIIDEFTGRVKEGSSWREGLHQAIEAKEGVTITSESQSQASISRQKFYRLYEKVCGMSGTAMESAGEFWQIYEMPVQSIPRNKPSLHQIWEPRVFRSLDEKLTAAVDEIEKLHQSGRPVLVGTRTIETSEELSSMLHQKNVSHLVLNANHDADEARIISAAGQKGAVTISTNMAGRGTHIALEEEVEQLGGLHVLVLEMDESQRIDRQLLGRAARQGKPGSGQLFLSLEDHLIQRFAPEIGKQLLSQSQLNAESIFRRLQRIQSIAEVQAYRDRLTVMEKDRWSDETKLRLT